MSKCYAIKNKDGKYISKYINYDYSNEDYYKHTCTTNDIRNARLIKNPVECVSDLECVECTICEGDIEKELEVYKKAIKLQKEFAEKIIYKLNYRGGSVSDDIPDSEYFLCQAREVIEKEKTV